MHVNRFWCLNTSPVKAELQPYMGFVSSVCLDLLPFLSVISALWFLNDGGTCLVFYSRFFAGGSERSGQQIVGPPKKKSSNEVVEDLFKGAKEHGAVPLDRSGKGPETSRAKVEKNFPIEG